MKETGVEDIIKTFVRKGIVYSGWSAGACIVGPTLRFAETMDDPSQVPEVIYDGINIIDKVVIPHILIMKCFLKESLNGMKDC
jgi:dipeptidase E